MYLDRLIRKNLVVHCEGGSLLPGHVYIKISNNVDYTVLNVINDMTMFSVQMILRSWEPEETVSKCELWYLNGFRIRYKNM